MGVLRASVSIVLILALSAGVSAGAHGTPDSAKPRQVLAAAGMSMDQAVKMAEQRFTARVVRAETQRDGDHTVYVLKLLNDAGRVWTVRVDAASGAVL
jgi:uncharacterized membrane protein YkoI